MTLINARRGIIFTENKPTREKPVDLSFLNLPSENTMVIVLEFLVEL